MKNREVAELILKGQWPEDTFHPDFQLEIIHQASIIFYDLDGKRNPEAIQEGINNLALWLGGLQLDMQVYAWQYLRRYCGFEVLADDKTSVRLTPLEDRIFLHKPYNATFAKDITKFHWKVVYLDGTTYEEHVEALLEELGVDLDSGELTGNIVLSGQARAPADTQEENGRVIKESCEELVALLEKYGKPNILYHEKMDNYIAWLMLNKPEVAIMGFRTALAIFRLPMDNDQLKNWRPFYDAFGQYVNNV